MNRRFDIRLLQRYVLLEVLRSFGVCFVVLTVVLFSVSSMKLIHKGLNVIQLRGALLASGLSFFPYLIPFAFMTGLVMAFGRLSADNEILAMRAIGVHLGRLLPPVIACGLVLSAAAFLLNAWVIPGFQRKLETLEVDIFRGFLSRLQSLPTRIISFPAYDLYVGDVEGQRCYNIIAFQVRGHRVCEILRADAMDIELQPERGGIQLQLTNCHVITPAGQPPKYLRQAFFGSLRRYVDMAFKAPKVQIDPEQASFGELLRMAENIEGSLAAYPGLLCRPKKVLRTMNREEDALLIEFNRKRRERQRAKEVMQVEDHRLRRFEYRAQSVQEEMKRSGATPELKETLEKAKARAEEARDALKEGQDVIAALSADLMKINEQRVLIYARMQQAQLQRQAIDVLAEIHKRFALAVAPLVLSLVAVPLGVAVTRKGFLTALGVSFAFALFAYYPLSLLGDMLSRYTRGEGAVFLWLPNGFALAVGVVLLVRMFRR
ncbi:MAG: LptF/LptG family permease [Planctomycetes bacterium]|nr:LptF/LptG family permease [Planctomycetota bacterium]